MKRKHVTKALALAMSTVMLVGCGKVPGAENGKEAETKSSAESSGSESEEPVEIRLFVQYDSSTEVRSSKYMVEQMEKDLNIKLVREEVPVSAYSERLQLAMADGDYPDAFVFDSHSDPLLLSAIDNGIIIPVNDLIKDKENLQKYIAEETYEAAKVKNDDNIYLIPRCSVARMDGYMVRKDWMENLGITVDEDAAMTKEGFLDMLEKMTTGDPDGNGKDDTYGYIYPVVSGMMDVTFPGAFDCLGWQESDGDYAYMDPQYEIGNENYKEALEYSQKVYQYSHPDSAVTTDQDALIYAGEVGAKPGFAGHVDGREQKLKEVNPEGSLTYVSGIRNDEGELHNVIGYPGIWGGVAITSACEHPEKVAEMMDWILSDKGWEYTLYGEPGYTYNKNDDGTIEIITDTYKEEYLQRGLGNLARRQEDINFFIDMSMDDEKIEELNGWLNTALNGGVLCLSNGKTPSIVNDTEFVEAENKRKEVRTKIIMGAMDVSEYDAVLEEWYERGGKEYVEEMNEIIANMQQ